MQSKHSQFVMFIYIKYCTIDRGNAISCFVDHDILIMKLLGYI